MWIERLAGSGVPEFDEFPGARRCSGCMVAPHAVEESVTLIDVWVRDRERRLRIKIRNSLHVNS
jgi:hypothetical protein